MPTPAAAVMASTVPVQMNLDTIAKVREERDAINGVDCRNMPRPFDRCIVLLVVCLLGTQLR